jgi:hypothetical protein
MIELAGIALRVSDELVDGLHGQRGADCEQIGGGHDHADRDEVSDPGKIDVLEEDRIDRQRTGAAEQQMTWRRFNCRRTITWPAASTPCT